MDITLEIGNGFYNARVSAHIIYQGKELMDYHDSFYFPIGGRIKSGETMEEAIVREIREELSVELKSCSLIAIGQATYHDASRGGAVHEHNFIFECEIEGIPKGRFGLLEENANVRPSYWSDIKTNFIHTEMSHYEFMDLDISKMMDCDIEFNVRISAIIRNGDKILFDNSSYDPKHIVLIGGRMQMGETFEEALRREVREELSVELSSCSYLGVGEDFFSLEVKENNHKQIHFINFVYEVDVDLEAIVFADGAKGVWFHKDELPPMHMESILRFIG